MKYIRYIFPVFIVAFVTLIIGCNKIRVGTKEEIILEYYFSQSDNQPTVASYYTTKFTTVDNVYATVFGDTVLITLDGVRISTNKKNYSIETFEVFECNESSFDDCKKKDWDTQFEFTEGSNSIQTKLLVVLVLDVSTSLGSNINSLKTYAKDFANEVLKTEDSHIGLVLFSKDVISYDFKNINDLDSINSFIDNYTNYQGRTSLYEACNVGLQMLESSNLGGLKNLVIFTDGGDNNTDNPESAKQQIISSPITRYAIGLKGEDFKKDELEELASKKSNYVLAKNIDDLQTAFEDIQEQVSTVYTIDYYRSAQILKNEIQIKFLFRL